MNDKRNTTSNSLTNSPLSSRRLVSIDPGLNKLGLAAFEGTKLTDYAVKVVPPAPPIRARLIALDEVLDRYFEEKKPDVIALEKTTFSSSTQNSLLVLAYYKILAVARRRHIPVHEYVPITIRKSVCGNGHATKRDVMKVLISQYPELRIFSCTNRRWAAKHNSDLFDAVAVGLTDLKRRPNYGPN